MSLRNAPACITHGMDESNKKRLQMNLHPHRPLLAADAIQFKRGESAQSLVVLGPSENPIFINNNFEKDASLQLQRHRCSRDLMQERYH